MVRNFRANARPARRLAIALFGAAAVIAIVACTEVVTREPPPQSATELRNVNIVGVTTTDGRGIEFDTGTDVDIEEPAAPEDPIVVRATVNGMPYEIELEDIQRIWVARQELSEGGRIALITVGVVALIETLAGNPVQGHGVLELQRLRYDKKGNVSEKRVGRWNLATSDEGTAHQKLKASRPGQYRLSYTVTRWPDRPR